MLRGVDTSAHTSKKTSELAAGLVTQASRPGQAAAPSSLAVTFMADPAWSGQLGACCWREALVQQLGSQAGVDVTRVQWHGQAGGSAEGKTGQGNTKQAQGFSAIPVRALRKLRRVLKLDAAQPCPAAKVPARQAQALGALLAGARLIVAETVEQALLARQVAPAGCQVWAVLIPRERPMPGQPVSWAQQWHQAVDAGVDGFIADSQAARDSIERVLSPHRIPVVVVPAVAIDRACPACEQLDAGPGSVPETPTAPLDQLALWWQVRQEARQGQIQRRRWSFALSRLVGEDAHFAPDLSRWGPVDEDQPPLTITQEWSALEQAQGVQALLDSAVPPRPVDAAHPARSVSIIGHSLKFIRELAGRLEQRGGWQITLDEWDAPATRNGAATEKALASAQTLVAEWIRPNAAYLSQHKRDDQYLVARLHRFELDSEYPAHVNIDAVDAVVYISPLLGRRIAAELGWPVEKLVYIPNFVDVGWLDRPKYPDARFCLGLAGAVPSRKRLDYALDVLAAVRSQDPRFTLSVRTTHPWEDKYAWRDAAQRRHYQQCLQRVETDPLLRGAVTLDYFGRDIAAWLRRIGIVLSTADAEGAPVAISEGMASAAVPVVRPWDGSRELFGDWIAEDGDAAAQAVLQCADPMAWTQARVKARDQARVTFNPVGVLNAWEDLLRGEREAAKTHFARWVNL